MILSTSSSSSATTTPGTPIPAQAAKGKPAGKSADYEIEKNNQLDAKNRENIALGVIVTSILAVVVISCAVVVSANNRENASKRVMESTLPLYGTWVGTILAFYFSRNAFEAASSATNRNTTLLHQITSDYRRETSPPPDNVLSKIVLKSLANNLVFSQNDLNKPLQDVLSELNDKRRYRTIVIDAENQNKYINLVYRIHAAAFLASPGDSQAPSSPPTLGEYLNWRNEQGVATPTVVFLPLTATLADADAKLKASTGCRDVIVTTDGKEDSPVVVYVSDVDINEYKNASTALAA